MECNQEFIEDIKITLLLQMHDEFQKMKVSMTESFRSLEATVNHMMEIVRMMKAGDDQGHFYNASVGQGLDRVYALGMCIQGANRAVCSNCIDLASKSILEKCPNQTEGLAWPENGILCMFAMAEYGHNNYGAKVNLSIWEPKVSPTQFSSASMLIAGGSKEQFQSIRAGWIVYQWLNRNHSRLYTYWTADGFTKTGCYNTLCPGFVQVSKRVPLGILLEPVSVYDGDQSEVGIVIYKDVVTGNWWLFVHDEMVGYWPNSLFTKSGLGHGAGLVSYGGEVYSPVNEKSPGMGSGHFPAEGYTKAAYVNGFEVVCNNDSIFSEPSFPVMMFANTPKCYRVMPGRGQLRVWFDSLFYGGPRGCV
ncbi:hypothetical protein Bca52824_091201 [Brassica carinata]|uniref:Neprosin domain-containing protein n=1 Tax=Brassica carinata TaxID=52824 RepID=A0A8X7TFC6_BRACI|nr:hypothetical protein Bca52824_091201 [Brassica carinata]